MEQPEEVEEYLDGATPVDHYEIQTEASNVETKEHENKNTTPRRENSGKGFDRLKMKLRGKKYYS